VEIVIYKYSVVTSKCTFSISSINCALVQCYCPVLLVIMSTIIKIGLSNNEIECDISTNYVSKYSFRL